MQFKLEGHNLWRKWCWSLSLHPSVNLVKKNKQTKQLSNNKLFLPACNVRTRGLLYFHSHIIQIRNFVQTKKADELLQLSVSQQMDSNEFSPAPFNHSTAPVVFIWIYWIILSKCESRRDLTSDLLSDSDYRHRVCTVLRNKSKQRRRRG